MRAKSYSLVAGSFLEESGFVRSVEASFDEEELPASEEESERDSPDPFLL